MYVYLRIFLACVPTQLVKAFVIKRLNIYCLVQTVSPAETEALLGRGGGLPYAPGPPVAFLFKTDLCTASLPPSSQ